jgi:hypothetical protein
MLMALTEVYDAGNYCFGLPWTMVLVLGGSMRVYLVVCALMFWLAWSFDADAHDILVLDCGGDWDCEVQAEALCNTGHLKWCVKEA